MHDYGWYAARFGWTPRQVDEEVPGWVDARFAQFMAVWDEVAAARRAG